MSTRSRSLIAFLLEPGRLHERCSARACGVLGVAGVVLPSAPDRTIFRTRGPCVAVRDDYPPYPVHSLPVGRLSLERVGSQAGPASAALRAFTDSVCAAANGSGTLCEPVDHASASAKALSRSVSIPGET